MNYLYHLVPENMQGEILYPLNELKKIYPKAYKEHVKKYEDRKYLLKEKVPFLNCLWNDVLHLTAVNPITINKTLEEIGFKPPIRKWFKINPRDLVKDNTLVFLFERARKITTKKDYEWFDISKIKKYSELSQKTINYYESSYKNNERPLLFNYVPHILYKGSINISKLEIITV